MHPSFSFRRGLAALGSLALLLCPFGLLSAASEATPDEARVQAIPAPPYLFVKTDLGTPRNPDYYCELFPNGVNNHGLVAVSGFIKNPEGIQEPVLSFWHRDTGYREVALAPEVFRIRPYGLNDAGRMVGDWHGAGAMRHAFVADQSTGLRTLFPPEGYTHASAQAINNSDVIVGYAGRYEADGAWVVRPCIWRTVEGAGTILKSPAGARAVKCTDINAAGQAVGIAYTEQGDRALLWEPDGTLRILQSPEGYPRTGATSINDHGQIAGYATPADYTPDLTWLVVWDPLGNPRRIAPSHWTSENLAVINNHGQVLFPARDPEITRIYPALWDGAQVLDLIYLTPRRSPAFLMHSPHFTI